MNIVIIGSGNIASQLAKAFYAADNKIMQIYSRTLANAQALANVVNSDAIADLSKIDKSADLYIIAVVDDVISTIANQLPTDLSGIVIHTSGATSIDILGVFQNRGVIYPPQSINKDIQTDIDLIPFGVEGNSPETLEKLFSFIQSIAPKSFPCTSKQRLALHIAAVMANNFSNALFQMAADILKHEQLDFELIRPIILETAIKVQNHLPSHTQTGPAVRNDFKVIDKHLQFLSQTPDVSKIYQLLTDFIVKRSLK